mmetsp:Transcript_29733/g.76807  ORF Transcript_29733/g.76807 Transcript_29733/m.76807 type:complete len:210 (-) Transcript_29733:3084-3713(-)
MARRNRRRNQRKNKRKETAQASQVPSYELDIFPPSPPQSLERVDSPRCLEKEKRETSPKRLSDSDQVSSKRTVECKSSTHRHFTPTNNITSDVDFDRTRFPWPFGQIAEKDHSPHTDQTSLPLFSHCLSTNPKDVKEETMEVVQLVGDTAHERNDHQLCTDDDAWSYRHTVLRQKEVRKKKKKAKCRFRWFSLFWICERFQVKGQTPLQ